MPEENDTTRKSWRDRFRRAKGDAAPNRRRRLLIGAGVLLLIVLFVVVPGYIATRPSFMHRYSHFNEQYVSWSTSAHANVPCQKCHVRPGFLAQSAYSVRMLGEFYLSTVDPSRQPKLFPPPTNAACQSCHSRLVAVSPSGDLNIPHRAHVEVLKLDCVRCHRYLVHEVSPEGNHNPPMQTCLTCHDGKQAKNGCSTCHTNKDIPASHRQPDWIVIHPQMQTKVDCKTCHKWTEHWCADCHAKRPASHTADWRTKHGEAVEVHRNCEACHASAFCVRCHGVVPQTNFNPALKLVQ